MELIILGGIAAAIYLAWDTLDLRQRGGFTARDVRAGAKLFVPLAVVAAVILGALFGVAALVALWPFWLLVAVLTGAWWGIGKLWARTERQAAPRQTLDARMTELRAQGPLPAWAAGIEARQAAQPKQQKRGLLSRLDDWMGL